jgi:hypothetical protein
MDKRPPINWNDADDRHYMAGHFRLLADALENPALADVEVDWKSISARLSEMILFVANRGKVKPDDRQASP